MLTEIEHKRLKFIINILYFAAILCITWMVFKFAFSWILPFVIAFGVSFMLDPIIIKISEKFKIKRTVVSTLCVTILLIIIVVFFALLSTTIIREIRSFFGNLDNYIQRIYLFAQTLPVKYGHLFGGRFNSVLTHLSDFIKNFDYSGLLSGSFGSGALKYAGSFITSLPSALIFIIVSIVATYFSSASFPIIKCFILKQFSPKTREIILAAKFHFSNTLAQYFKSYIILMSITFAELCIAFWIFGFKPVILLSFIIALVDIFPVLGVGTILIPWSIVELLLGDPISALILLGIYIAVTIVRQILEPKIISVHVGLLPIVTVFCIYVGLRLFGVIGMFIVPILVIILKNLHDAGYVKIWK